MRHAFAIAALLLGLPGLPAHAADLLDVYTLAQEKDPVFRAAVAQRLAALEAVPQARALLKPNAAASANATKVWQDIETTTFGTSGSRDFDNTGYALSLSQPLYNRSYLVQLRQAHALVAQAEANYLEARLDLMVRTAQRYFNVLAAEDNLAFARAEREAIEEQLKQTRQRFEVGLTAITDVREAQARYDLAVAREIEAENTLAVTREALRELTGVLYEDLAPLTARVPLLTPDPADVEPWVATALEQNLPLLQAREAVDIARADVDLQRAARYPSLDVVGTHAYSDTGGIIGREQTENTIGLELSWPFYQGGAISSRVREAGYQLEAAQETLEQQRRATVSQTRSAYLNVLSGISQVKALRQSVASAETALEATQAGFEVGTRTAVDVLQSQQVLFQARADYARSRYDYILDTLALKQASGTLEEADLLRINRWLGTRGN